MDAAKILSSSVKWFMLWSEDVHIRCIKDIFLPSFLATHVEANTFVYKLIDVIFFKSKIQFIEY